MEGEIDMNASELRIGNYVEYFKSVKAVVSVNREGGTWMIGAADHKGDLTKVRNVEDGFNGIPITEEWMAKLGLRTDGYSESYSMQIGDGNYSSDGGNIIIINTQKYNDGESYTGDGWLFCTLSTLTSDFDSYGFKARIKYVHQLQNLYFALTGEELTIKE